MIEIRNRKILVVGLGYRSGLTAANFLAEKGGQVAVSDSKSRDELAGLIEKLAPGVDVLAGGQSPSVLDPGFDLIVLSPGVPASIPLIREARSRNIPVISEIELAFNFIKGAVIAITGTDGKSTVTTLVHRILEGMGCKAFIGGNIGIPAVSLADRTDESAVTVLELSSYQLETIDKFRPGQGAILNITPDHLDRYSGMEAYRDAKFRIAINQTPDDTFVYNGDDSFVVEKLADVKSKKRGFSLHDKNADIYYNNGKVYLSDGTPVLNSERMLMPGMHSIQNAMAALLLSQSFFESRGWIFDFEKASGIITSFEGLEHRMQVVGSFKDRTFINDSKATTTGAVEMALRGFDGNAVLIMGGRAKGDDYSRLLPVLKKGARGLVLIGETADEFSEIFKDLSPVTAADLEEAVFKAMGLTSPGDSVILSPACASFDMFADYEERGKAFVKAFSKLSGGVTV